MNINERLLAVPEVTQQVNGRTKVQNEAVWPQKPTFVPSEAPLACDAHGHSHAYGQNTMTSVHELLGSLYCIIWDIWHIPKRWPPEFTDGSDSCSLPSLSLCNHSTGSSQETTWRCLSRAVSEKSITEMAASPAIGLWEPTRYRTHTQGRGCTVPICAHHCA